MSVTDLILGRPLASDEKEQVKIGVVAGVPAMGLDGLTSSAYGPEAALTVLITLGAAGLAWIGPITAIILLLLAMLYFSYRQTISAYPVNGGSYTVARENLGTWAGLLAAAALMIDYVLNVAVGISAGVAALVSAFPALGKYTVPLCLGILALITVVNLRGTGEAGLAFALPTYAFIVTLLIVLAVGVCRALTAGGHPRPVEPPPPLPPATTPVTLWMLLRCFASGCAAMTGVEAVSNGVNAFREPRVLNAQRTLTVIVVLLAILLAGIAYLAGAYRIGAMQQDVKGYQSVLSQLTSAVFGRGWFYYITIASVLASLCLSANTSFVGFPRLSRLIAGDDFLPRSFATVGRRLVYSVGILFLAVTAGLLLIAFRGITDKLIPLFAVGAFLAFTLSQAGMVLHWRHAARGRGRGSNGAAGRRSHLRMWVNGVGAVATGIALAVILIAKFTEGAWITVLAIPTLLLLFRSVHRHYQRVDEQVRTRAPLDLHQNQRPVVLVPIRRWDKLANKALRFSLWLSTEVTAVHLSNLSGDEAQEEDQRVRREWARDVEEPCCQHGVPAPRLVFAQTPYRDFLKPLLHQIDRLKAEYPGRLIGVVVPELVETHWWYVLLHRRKPARLRAALYERCDRRVIVISVPWYVQD